LDVTRNFPDEPRREILALVDRDRRTSSVRIAKLSMRAFRESQSIRELCEVALWASISSYSENTHL
jgi:hypothetical protein